MENDRFGAGTGMKTEEIAGPGKTVNIKNLT
jgi:hypothetical protein